VLLKTEDLIFPPLLKVVCFQLPESYEVIHKSGSPIYGSLNLSAGLALSELFPKIEFWKLVYGFVVFLLVSAGRIQNNTL